jgi:hypothetical protein
MADLGHEKIIKATTTKAQSNPEADSPRRRKSGGIPSCEGPDRR